MSETLDLFKAALGLGEPVAGDPLGFRRGAGPAGFVPGFPAGRAFRVFGGGLRSNSSSPRSMAQHGQAPRPSINRPTRFSSTWSTPRNRRPSQPDPLVACGQQTARRGQLLPEVPELALASIFRADFRDGLVASGVPAV